MDTPAGQAFGLRVLARLDPDRAAPLARVVAEGLLARANDARIAYLEAADPSVVEACIAESAADVLVDEPTAPAGERRQLRPLRLAAKPRADAIALLRGRHDGRSWHALWSLVGVVVQRTEGGKREADPPLRGARAPTFVALLSEALRGSGFVGARDLPKGLAAPG